MALGITELNRKMKSIPESEPLFTLIKSRTIKLSEIKNKDERKYWRNLKKINKIPQIYLTSAEIYENLKKEIGNGKRLNQIQRKR